MVFMAQVIFALMCIAVTFVGAICGVGGGVILKPVLDATSAYSVEQINLLCGVTVLSMTLATFFSSRDVRSNLKGARMALILLGATVGGMLGKGMFSLLIAQMRDTKLIGMIQNIVLLLLTVGTLWYEMNRWKIRTKYVEKWWAVVLVSLSLGMVSTFLGIGGGPFNLIVLIHCFSMETSVAITSSLMIILFSQGVSFAETLINGQLGIVPVDMLIVSAVSGVLGGLIGRFASGKMDEGQIDRMFLGLLTVIILICAANAVKFATG